MTTEIEPVAQLSEEAVRSRVLILLEHERPDGDYKVADLVAKTVAFLRENDPELLRMFADQMVAQTLHNYYRKKLRDRRARQRRSTLEAQFRAAVENVELRGDWFVQSFTVAENTVRRVADMTGKDHRYLADRYQASGQRDLLLAAFHRRVAALVGNKRTEEAMTEDEYERMFRAVVKESDEWTF